MPPTGNPAGSSLAKTATDGTATTVPTALAAFDNGSFVIVGAGFADGSFVIGGDFAGSVIFGLGTGRQKTLSTPTNSAWDRDAYVARYNADGSY